MQSLPQPVKFIPRKGEKGSGSAIPEKENASVHLRIVIPFLGLWLSSTDLMPKLIAISWCRGGELGVAKKTFNV
jgi:hypothetical protein